ncbi:hypothetical protein EWM64_g3492 [Hericium alpestre]|uniref:Uncharacterized protein n=1 Tax=Hericium alpestre TaxID=135208 RepID=A0A4Z0A2S4_9AGAM|nr:hypothetical protein EWM64_g3492 [Hericium alpestre]
MPRAQKPPAKQRHDPLHVQLGEDEVHAKYGRVSQPGKRRKSRQNGEAEENGDVILDPKTSKRIFELAKSQQEELEEPDEEDVVDDDFTRPRLQDLEEAEEEEDVENYHGFIDLDEEEHELQIDSGDIKALDSLLPPNAGERKTLADLIFAKLDSASGSGTAVIQPSGEVLPRRPAPEALQNHPLAPRMGAHPRAHAP